MSEEQDLAVGNNDAAQTVEETSEAQTATGVKRSANDAQLPDTATRKPRAPRAARPKAKPFVDVLHEEFGFESAADVLNHMRSFEKSDAARKEYETFLASHNPQSNLEDIESVSFGDIIQVVPAIKTNKRKFQAMIDLDIKLAQVYQEAREGFEHIGNKALALKLEAHARHLRQEQKLKREEEKRLAAEQKAAAAAAAEQNNDEEQ